LHGRNHSVQLERNMKPTALLIGGAIVCILNFVGLVNGYWLFEPTRNPYILYPMGLGPLGIWLSLLEKMQLKMRYTKFFFNWMDGKLSGVHRYAGKFEEEASFLEKISEALLSDGFGYAGEIENSFNSSMDVYQRRKKKAKEAVLLIKADVFTMDQLLEHRYLFASFMENSAEEGNFSWRKEITTLICVQEMSAPLQILLSTTSIYPTTGLYPPRPNQALGSQVIAYVAGEQKIYASPERLDNFLKRFSPSLKVYMIGEGLSWGEIVWEQNKWHDVLYLDWRTGVLASPFCYGSMRKSTSDCIKDLSENLCTQGYQFAGEIKNHLGAYMDVYIRHHNQDIETVLMIEADTFTMDMLHEHRNMFRAFMKSYLGMDDYTWYKGLRIVICAEKMSPSLQAMLIALPQPPYKGSAYVCAYVNQEKRLYTLGVFHPDSFQEEHIPWCQEYFPEVLQQEPLVVWKDLDWNGIEGLPYGEKEMIVLVHKALNVWRE
jgi:hypothetical protein